MMGKIIPPFNVERFESLIDKSGGDDACWIWLGGRHRFGYGVFNAHDTAYGAHRVAYHLWRGPIPDGIFVCHACDNPPCCNPAHLFLGTAADNMADKVAKGRQTRKAPAKLYRGMANSHSKLTDDQVREIRRRYVSVGQLAHEYGVHAATIRSIIDGRSWSHVIDPDPAPS